MIVVLMGPPGSGKGTQAVKLADKTGLPHIAVGDMLREAIAKQTDLGKKAAQYMNAGKLVPDELTIDLVAERLSRKDCEEGFILDGFPRSKQQADALDEILEDMDYEVLYIDIPLDQVIARNSKRLSCRGCGAVYSGADKEVCEKCGGELYKREDDNPEIIKQRFEVYIENTKPLVDFYEEKGNLLHIDGVGSIDDVFSAITRALEVA